MGTYIRTTLAEAACELERVRWHKRSVSGIRAGVAIRFSLEGSGFRVTARVSPGPYVLDLCARNHRLDSQEGEGGEPIEIPFDEAFILTGAPAPFVAQLFDESIKRRLRYLAPRHVEIDDGAIHVIKRYAVTCAEPEKIRAAIDIATRLARRVEAYLTKVHQDALTEGQNALTPYRSVPDRRRLSMILANRYLPVASYLDRKDKAVRKRQRRARAALGVLFLWGVVVFLANALGHS